VVTAEGMKPLGTPLLVNNERFTHSMNKSQSVPAYSLYGVPQNNQRLSAISGSRIAPPSAPYVGRGNKCSGNEDTCEGMRAKGTEFCMGHLRSVKKVSVETKAVDDVSSTDDTD